MMIQWTTGNKARLPGYLVFDALWNDLAKPLYTSIPADRIQLEQVQINSPSFTGVSANVARFE